MARRLGYQRRQADQHFSDVPTTNPFYPFVETAYNHSIISGYSDGTFRPNNYRHPRPDQQDRVQRYYATLTVSTRNKVTTARNSAPHAGGRIALVTYAQDPTLSRGDRLLGDALVRRGCDVQAVRWDDPAAEWASFDVCVIRSTWDYHHRLTEFLAWAERTSKLTSLSNR